MKPILLPALEPKEAEELERLYRQTKDVRLRTRAQMILLAVEKHLKAVEIAEIVRESEETVRRWMKRYLAEGLQGLEDAPRSGASPKITQTYRELLLQAVHQRPRSLGQPYSMWTLQRLADYLAEQTGIRASDETVRQVLKTQEIVLSRPQHTISSPDPEYKVKKRRLKRRETG